MQDRDPHRLQIPDRQSYAEVERGRMETPHRQTEERRSLAAAIRPAEKSRDQLLL